MKTPVATKKFCIIGHRSKADVVSKPELILGPRLRPASVVVCAWGDDGAAARDRDGSIHICPAVTPESGKVVETIGAGDTLIATMIAALTSGMTLAEALTVGCNVAGNKVGQVGFGGLKKYFKN